MFIGLWDYYNMLWKWGVLYIIGYKILVVFLKIILLDLLVCLMMGNDGCVCDVMFV